MLFGVFAHVETYQLYAQLLCKDACHLRLADTSRTDE